MVNYYFCRHCERLDDDIYYPSGKGKKIWGEYHQDRWWDSPLSWRGECQARETAEWFIKKKIVPDFLYISTFTRCWQTSTIMIAVFNSHGYWPQIRVELGLIEILKHLYEGYTEDGWKKPSQFVLPEMLPEVRKKSLVSVDRNYKSFFTPVAIEKIIVERKTPTVYVKTWEHIRKTSKSAKNVFIVSHGYAYEHIYRGWLEKVNPSVPSFDKVEEKYIKDGKFMDYGYVSCIEDNIGNKKNHLGISKKMPFPVYIETYKYEVSKSKLWEQNKVCLSEYIFPQLTYEEYIKILDITKTINKITYYEYYTIQNSQDEIAIFPHNNQCFVKLDGMAWVPYIHYGLHTLPSGERKKGFELPYKSKKDEIILNKIKKYINEPILRYTGSLDNFLLSMRLNKKILDNNVWNILYFYFELKKTILQVKKIKEISPTQINKIHL